MPVEQKMPEPLIKTGIYKHFKKNDLYFVTGIVIDAETDQAMVLYYSLYNESPPFFRRFSNFEELIRVRINNEGKDVKRFELVRELPVEKFKFFMPEKSVLLSSESGVFLKFKICKVLWEDEKIVIYYKDNNGYTNQEHKCTLEDFFSRYGL